ncbi:MAG: hypothetical protein NTY48_06130 [Candidatus Diapherotrites archaeon]|nr:hypothetical protein [Candidatus Diapherotrites archaeon]
MSYLAMNKALEIVQKATEYKKYRTRKLYQNSRRTVLRAHLKRTKRARTLMKQKAILTEVKKAMFEKQRLLRKLLRREKLTEAEEKKIPSFFWPKELQVINRRTAKVESMEKTDAEMEEILKRAQTGKLTEEDIRKTIVYFGCLKPATRYSRMLKIVYNDKMTAEGKSKLRFEEDRSTKAIRRALLLQQEQ